MGIRPISRQLSISRNTVRKVLSNKHTDKPVRNGQYIKHIDLVHSINNRCKGNMTRVRQILADDHNIEIPYSSLTHLGRHFGMREPKKKQSGKYVFEAGAEMQHDTTIYKIRLGKKIVQLSCAGLILGYSRMSYIQFFPRFTRFEALFFLSEAFQYIGGVCKRCTIDNTSVLVAEGSGPDAIISEKIRQFGVYFGTTFIPHAIGHADRKAHVERLFSYVERNFLSGRTFSNIIDLNKQARQWCDLESNAKPKRSLGMSPNQAIISERPFLVTLPDYIPPIYESQYRIVDIYGNIHLDTNRYSVPYKYIGQKVEVQKHINSVVIYANRKKIAQHQRIIDGRYRRMTDSSHRSCDLIKRKKRTSCAYESSITGINETLDQYVRELKKRTRYRTMLKKLLILQQTYPEESFNQAISRALRFGLYDLNRLEALIVSLTAGKLFNL